jgi:yeast amino acid transporter
MTCRIKVVSISIFFIVGIAISAGGIGPQKIGFKYYHDPGAFADSINGVAKTFVIAGTLYAGTEMYGSSELIIRLMNFFC